APRAGYAHELETLVVALGDRLLDDADAGSVELVLGRARLEGAGLDRHERLLEGAFGNLDGLLRPRHARLVEGVPGVVLLAVGVPGSRVTGHDDPGLGAVDSRLPGVGGARQGSVVDLPGVL